MIRVRASIADLDMVHLGQLAHSVLEAFDCPGTFFVLIKLIDQLVDGAHDLHVLEFHIAVQELKSVIGLGALELLDQISESLRQTAELISDIALRLHRHNLAVEEVL